MALIACFIRVERPERLRGLSEALALAEAAATGSTSDVAAGDLELEERLETALETALRDRQVVLETAPDGTDEDSHLRTLQVLSRTLHTDAVSRLLAEERQERLCEAGRWETLLNAWFDQRAGECPVVAMDCD